VDDDAVAASADDEAAGRGGSARRRVGLVRVGARPGRRAAARRCRHRVEERPLASPLALVTTRASTASPSKVVGIAPMCAEYTPIALVSMRTSAVARPMRPRAWTLT
jgi:hypothetical protein